MATIKNDHFIFAKDYVAPKPLRKKIEDDPFMVDNQDDFFSGLPDNPGALRKRKRGLVFADKNEKR